jgi:DNA polymerase-1
MIAIVDSDFIPFIACYDKPDKEGVIKEKSLKEAIEYCDHILNGIFKDTKADSYILALTKGKCFRYDIYPDYKGNRKYKQELKYFKEVKQHLIDNYGAIYHIGLEADDIVNICRLNLPDSFIVSVDKDLLSLEGLHYNPKSKQWVTTSKTQAEYDFAFDMVVGQPGDNLKGIKGKGPVYAVNLLNDKFGEKDLLNVVFNSYLCNYSSKEEAIDEFYKNFKCLTIVNSWRGFNIPEPKKVTILEEGTEVQDEFKERVVKE